MLVAFNKPFGVVTQFSGDGRTLKDYIDIPGIYPAGRLDKDSEGLLLLTDDGKLQARIASPKFKLPKTYWVLVEREPTEESLEQLRSGVKLKDGMTKPADVKRIDEPAGLWERDPPVRYRKNVVDVWLEITLREGKNRQVRRMTAAVGHPTLRLVRAAIGPVRLDGMTPGQSREIDPSELR